jgi:molybdate transport system substrate-binding protein
VLGAATLALALTASAAAAELMVLAAASLTNAYKDIGIEFEKANPGEVVIFNFAASDVLLTQIARGAPADVFASADQDAMNRAQAQNLIDNASRHDFARNRLVVVTPAGKAAPKTLADLAGPSYKRIALSTPATVPAGRYAKAALESAGLWPTLEPSFIMTQNVRQSLDYVARGECDAGFVYSTDAAIMPGKVAVAFEVPTATPVAYPVAVVKSSTRRAQAEAFVEYLKSPAARAILVRYGFGVP